MAAIVGFGALAAFLSWERHLILLFTTDQAVIDILSGKLWFVLSIVQPINAAVFVYDGLLYASQSFAFVRNMMLAGFVVVFCPILAIANWGLHTLWSVWAAKAALNTWRLCAAIWRIHGQLLHVPRDISRTESLLSC